MTRSRTEDGGRGRAVPSADREQPCDSLGGWGCGGEALEPTGALIRQLGICRALCAGKGDSSKEKSAGEHLTLGCPDQQGMAVVITSPQPLQLSWFGS